MSINTLTFSIKLVTNINNRHFHIFKNFSIKFSSLAGASTFIIKTPNFLMNPLATDITKWSG